MKNYYEILEVDIHASSEVIDKAFKVLAKKYHPDTQEDSKKEWAEEQFKMLNEAYEVLSDETKREEYTKELEFDRDNRLNALMLKNTDLELQIEDLKAELEAVRNSTSTYQTTPTTYTEATYAPPKQPMYEPEIPSYSYRKTYTEQPVYYETDYHPIKSKLKSFIALLGTIFVLILTFFLLWKIPYTHDLLVKFYEENSVIQSIVNLFYQ